MKKLLFFDIDGTLVDFGKSTMSPSTADALINAKQNGQHDFSLLQDVVTIRFIHH